MKRGINAKTVEYYRTLAKQVRAKCERSRKLDDSDEELLNRVVVRLDLVLRLTKNPSLFVPLSEREANMFFEYVCDWALSGGKDDHQLHGNC